MDKIQKMATVDAEKWAFAELFYGEGAGTLRKLLDAEIQPKYDGMPGYREAFETAYTAVDKSKVAQMAIKHRKKLDRAAKAGKNMRAIKSGNIRGLSTGVYVAVGTAYVLHVTGYDKVVEAEMKKGWRKLKAEVNARRDGRKFRIVREDTYKKNS